MSEIGGFEPIPARKRPKKRSRDVREASVPNGGSASVLEGIRRGGLKGQRWTRVRQAYPRWVVRQRSSDCSFAATCAETSTGDSGDSSTRRTGPAPTLARRSPVSRSQLCIRGPPRETSWNLKRLGSQIYPLPDDRAGPTRSRMNRWKTTPNGPHTRSTKPQPAQGNTDARHPGQKRLDAGETDFRDHENLDAWRIQTSRKLARPASPNHPDGRA